MTIKKICSLVILFCGVKSFSQGPKFETLKLTSAPAYTVLGVDPQNIQRPTTPADFIAGAQSAIVNGKLQPNFAIEATPYYWEHPKTETEKRISLYKFLETSKSSLIENIARTFTFSFATSESDTLTFGDLDPGTGFGIGFKCNLFNGSVSKKTIFQVTSLAENKMIYNLYQDMMGDLQLGTPVIVSDKINKWKEDTANKKRASKELLDYAAEFVKKEIGKARLTEDDINLLQKKIDEIGALQTSVLADLNEAVFPLTREGFMLELAIGNASIVENNESKNITSAKTAIWLTPSYRINTRKDPSVIDYLDLMAVLRMTFNNSRVDVADYFDVGAKIQYMHNRFSFSGEYIARMLTKRPDNVESKWTNRLDLSFDYKLNEFVTFKATFGRNFDGNSVHYSDPKKMFAVGGFNFGFGEFLKKNN